MSRSSRSSVAPRSHYELLEVARGAPADEIKRAFRHLIARYHPDKVQHLGHEFQAIAAARAAELTEAYRVLSHAERRAEYDRLLGLAAAAPAPLAAPADDEPAVADGPRAGNPSRERASGDEFVRKAAIRRIREALDATAADTYDESELRGFDIACMPKARMFGRPKAPRLLGRVVAAVDAAAVRDAWRHAVRWASAREEICVLLLGSSLAPAPELAGAISDQRNKRPHLRLTLVPVDARDWAAHMPTDAPAVARDVLAWLRQQDGGGNKWS